MLSSDDDDEVYAATQAEAEHQRRSEREELQRQLLVLEREYRLLQSEHSALQTTCENRLITLEWIVALDESGNMNRQTVTLNQIINRVRSTLDGTKEVN